MKHKPKPTREPVLAIVAYGMHDFWCQVAIASLMTYMVTMNHDWHDCPSYGAPVPDSLPCLDCGAGL